ncbi:hypothetical protein OG21DRAFT_349393 [Imleria badia]|nr:hypothetical protein OG21DRAFT_349393 [Imleria badia]
MTEFIPHDTTNNLKSFASSVWGNAQEQDHTTGVEYIDLTSYIDAFELLFGSAVKGAKILVREEYRIALHELETNDTYCHGAYITGQPGIGKTLFLAYILVKHLGKRHTVAWELPNGSLYVLFRNTATFHSSADMRPLDEYGPLWALSDSNSRVRAPAGIFYSLPRHVRTIQTTSPEESRWKDWSKDAGAVCYVMDIWSEEEIADLAKLLNLDVERMTNLAKEWGGVPRSLLEFVRRGLTDSEIESTYKGPASKGVQKCREIYFCGPQKNAEPRMQRTLLGVSVPTRTIRRLLGEALQVQDNFLKLDFFRSLRQPDSTLKPLVISTKTGFTATFLREIP